MKIQKLTLCALLSALICLLAPLSLPFGAIPITLSTFAVYLIACTAELKISLTALIIYILLGAFGLPVFSGFTGGFQQLAGINGGYIIGYIPCLIIISLLISLFKNKKAIYPLSMLIGTILCYIFGTSWYIAQTKTSIGSAIMLCVVPFIAGDIIKIIVASILGVTLKEKLKKLI